MSFLSELFRRFTPAPPPDRVVREAYLRIIELVDPLLANISGFERKLGLPVQYALGYCNGLVDALPGPIEIERPAFANDPLVHALFATGNDIDQMLGKSQAVRDFLDEIESHTSEHFYALFAARRMEKHQLGVEVHGETVQSDVPQTVLYFSDHTLTEPAISLEAARERLRKTTFDSLLKTFRSQLDELRAERELLRSTLGAERGNLGLIKGHGKADEVLAHTLRVEAIDARLHEVAATLMPNAVLASLAGFLQSPEASLSLEACTLKVDRMGILSSGDSEVQDGDTLKFPELISRDRRRYLVTMARINRDEARRSVKDAIDQQRRYIVI